MRSRLFWKILIGFWITVLCMVPGVWVGYTMLSGDRLSFYSAVAEVVAPYQISAARLAIESGGVAKFDAELSRWTQERDQLPEWYRSKEIPIRVEIASDSSTDGSRNDIIRARAVDPQSREWDIIYTLRNDTQRETWGFTDFFKFYLSLDWAIPGLLGSFLFSAILAWYLTRPIQRLRSGFRKLAEGDLDRRLHQEMGVRRDEITDLAHDFDRMAERLQQLVLSKEQLLHDVSHELRSPLARLNLAVALVGKHGVDQVVPLQRIVAEVERLDELVGELLSLSRRESGELEAGVYFDMWTLTEIVVADARFEAQARGVVIDFPMDFQRSILIEGSAELIRRAVENIVRNAMNFSKSGDRIELELNVVEESGLAVLTISDHGPGVAEADLSRILEPFVRLTEDRARRGYGLGLAIANRAVRCHNGTLGLNNRAGGGLVVTLALPLAVVASDFVDQGCDRG